MSGSRKPQHGLTWHNADAIAEVRRSIEKGTLRVDPSAVIVLADIEEAIRTYAKSSAIVRVRAKNIGTPQREIERRRAHAEMHRVARVSTRLAWTADEMEMLARLYREGETTYAEIAERITAEFGVERTPSACETQASRMGIRMHVRRIVRQGDGHALVGTEMRRKSALSATMMRIRERRMANAERDRGVA